MMQQTNVTERLNYPSETQRHGLNTNTVIAIVIIILAALWARLGGITLDTTLTMVIKIPMWVMFLSGTGLALLAVFVARYFRDEYL